MILGIDGSNLGPSGSTTHLSNVLAEAQPEAHGIERVVVWAGSTLLSHLPQLEWLDKIRVKALDGSLPRRLLWQRFSLPALARRSCDVLFVPSGNTLARSHPYVAMSQNMLPFEWRELRRYGISWTSLRLLLLRLGQASTFRHADGLLFLTEYARGGVAKVITPLPPCSVAPHGIEQRFRMAPRPQRPASDCAIDQPLRLLYVSIVDVYKHQWQVARSIGLLREEGLPIELDFVGPAYGPALRRLLAVLRAIDPRGEFLRYRGPVPFARMHEVLASAELFVFASSCENMPNVLLEAMAAGLPIACSARGPMPEVLGDAGLYFDPEQPSDIANAVRTLILDHALRARLASLASERASKYSWRRCASETLGFVATCARRAAEARAFESQSWPARPR